MTAPMSASNRTGTDRSEADASDDVTRATARESDTVAPRRDSAPATAGSGASEDSAASIRVIFDINHPAQVHLFKNAIRELEREGHRTLVTSREKEVTRDLLDAYGIDHVTLSKRRSGVVGLVGELLVREVGLLSVARSFGPDVIVSRFTPPVAHVARLLGCRSLLVHDTLLEPRLVRTAMHAVTLPFADAVCTPRGFELSFGRPDHHLLDFQELAYLHPEYFRPDRSLLDRHGVPTERPYSVVRLAAWDAYHDVGHGGLSTEATRDLVELLSEHGAVYISSEAPLPPAFEEYRLPIPPQLVHHLLYYADLYVGDSGTMATEAAVLGTPAVRVNSGVGPDEENVFVELEKRYGLLHSFADETEALRKVEALLAADTPREEWRARRDRLVAEHQDVTGRLVELILALGEAGEHGEGRDG